MSGADDGLSEADALLGELIPGGGPPAEVAPSGELPEDIDLSEDMGSPPDLGSPADIGLPAGTAPPVGDWFSLAEEVDDPDGASGLGLGAAAGVTAAMAGAQPPKQTYAEPENERGRGRLLVLGVVSLLLIGAVAAAGFLLGRSSSDDVTLGGSDAAVGSEDSSADDNSDAADPASAEQTDGTDSAVDGGSGDASGDDASDDAGASDGSDADDGSDAQSSTTLPVAAEEFPDVLSDLTYTEMQARDLPHAVINGGQVFLRGRVPSKAISDLAAARIAPILGAGNFFVEFTVDPTVPIYTAAPVYVEDVVLFDFNSSEVKEDFFPLLELGTATMERYSTVTVKIVAFTDAVGSEEANLEVATERAQSVVEYWKARGIDTSRITIDARGESGASEDDDETKAAFNRRVEFIFDGIIS